MTIGDVLAAVAVIIGLSLSAWALLVGLALLFTGFAARAQEHLENTPGAAFGTGLALVATVGLAALALLKAPNGLLKLIGWLLLLVLLLFSALGAGGLALLLNHRIRGLEPELSEFKALCRGVALLVLAGFMPGLGWFVVTPLVVITSLGASIRTLWLARQPVASVALPTMAATETAPSTLSAPLPQTNLAYPFAATLPAAPPLAPPYIPTLSDETRATPAATTEGH